jgi:hypothetical protein
LGDSAERNAAAYRDILERLQRGESGNWREVRALHPDVSEPSWWRLVRKARQTLSGEQSVAKARQQLADHLAVGAVPVSNDDGRRKIDSERADNIPSVAAAFRDLDLLGQVKRQLADAELLRQYAINADGKIKAPSFLAQSISLRDRLVGTALRLAEAVWSLERQWQFYDAVVERVAVTSPETAHAIIGDLKALLPTKEAP